MPDYPNATPPQGISAVELVAQRLDSLASRMDRLEAKLDRVKDTTVEHDRTLIELSGRSGNNGRIGTLTDAVHELDQDVRALRAFQLKLVLSAFGGAGIAQGLIEAAKAMLGAG